MRRPHRASVSEASTKSKDYVREIAGYEGACGERGDQQPIDELVQDIIQIKEFALDMHINQRVNPRHAFTLWN